MSKCVCGREFYCGCRCQICSRLYANKHYVKEHENVTVTHMDGGRPLDSIECGIFDFEIPSDCDVAGIGTINICRSCAKKYKDEFTTIRERVHQIKKAEKDIESIMISLNMKKRYV